MKAPFPEIKDLSIILLESLKLTFAENEFTLGGGK